MRNLSEDLSSVWLLPEELAGVPKDVLNGLERAADSGRLCLSFKKPDVMAVLNHCTIPKIRERVFILSENICPENVDIFRETIALRHESARLLGYQNFAAWKLKSQMAKSEAVVKEFLVDLSIRLKPKAMSELGRLMAMKRGAKLMENIEDEDNNRFFLWDYNFYQQRMLEAEYQVDQESISEYFPAETVIRGMLDLFEHLFMLEIRETSEVDKGILSLMSNGSNCVWHDAVKMFGVWDRKSDSTEAFLGYLYTDIHPRPGKYNHAANFNIWPVRIQSPKRINYSDSSHACRARLTRMESAVRSQQL